MSDRYGPRGVAAIVIPVQNSNMQPEYEAMRPDGVSNQMYRFYLEGAGDTPRRAALRVIPDTLKCWPDIIIVGNSVEMRDVSVQDHLEYRAALTAAAEGTRVVTAAEACEAALHTIGARSIGVLNPMLEEHSVSTAAYYTELGFDVPTIAWLGVTKPELIIRTTRKRIHDVFRRAASNDIDAVLHVGGALGVVDELDDLEDAIGKPIVSVNAATYWFALRELGVSDAMPGFGSLLARESVGE